MPKQRITKEMVENTAFEIARSGGIEQVMVKTIAQKIGCSVQPIYSYCTNMEELRKTVKQRARAFIRQYVTDHVDPSDLFRSTGRAYVLAAKEEPYLFKLFILQEREGISSLDALYAAETDPRVAQKIACELGIEISTAKQLHLNMLIYTIGIGTIFAVTTPGISAEEIFAQQEIAYAAFLKQALEQGEQK